MSTPEEVIIVVHYRTIEDLHVFTSPDVYGLYVADKDPQAAFERVAPSLVHLLKLNEGIDGTVEPLTTYGEFMEMKRQAEADVDEPALPHPAVIEQTRAFRLRPAA